MIKVNNLRLCIFLFGIALYSCNNKAPQEPLVSEKKIEIKKKEITYFSDSIDSTFVLESLDTAVAIIEKLYFEQDEENPDGIFTFRGGNQRNSPVRGKINSKPKSIRLDWEFKTAKDSMRGDFGYWGGGAGWTGQPLVVNWKKNELPQLSNLKPEFLNRDELKEVVQISLSGYIYFLDFETGTETRPPLSIRNPIKGTPSIDPKNKDLLYVGHGIPHRGEMAWRTFHLKKQTLLHEEFLPSRFAYRKWGACDASPLIDTTSSTMIWPTESGVIYRHDFSKNVFDAIEQFRYKLSASSYQGIESSPSAYKQLGYFTDNGGNVFCADLRNMKPRWHFFNIDDSDASPVISIENEIPFVLIGNEVDKQGSEGFGYLRKLNGLSGKEVWRFEKKCYSSIGEKVNNGGMLSTALVGKEKAANMIYTIFSRTDLHGAGMLVAVDKTNGNLIFEVPLSRYSWVSPIAIYDQNGNPTLYVPTVNGFVLLIDGITGEVIFNQDMGCIFESSPIAWNNRIIQPARGNKIFSFVIE